MRRSVSLSGATLETYRQGATALGLSLTDYMRLLMAVGYVAMPKHPELVAEAMSGDGMKLDHDRTGGRK